MNRHFQRRINGLFIYLFHLYVSFYAYYLSNRKIIREDISKIENNKHFNISKPVTACNKFQKVSFSITAVRFVVFLFVPSHFFMSSQLTYRFLKLYFKLPYYLTLFLWYNGLIIFFHRLLKGVFDKSIFFQFCWRFIIELIIFPLENCLCFSTIKVWHIYCCLRRLSKPASAKLKEEEDCVSSAFK